MVNYVSRELAIGKTMVPSYTPFIVPNLADVPWPAPSAEHKSDIVKWNSNRQAGQEAVAQPLPLNAWALYQIRFIFAADLVGAWQIFGGAAAQLNHLSIVLHIATTDAIGVALTYDQLLKTHLEELARARATGTAGSADFHELLPNEQPRFKLQATQQRTKNVAKEAPINKKEKKEQLKKEKEKEKTAVPKVGWLPKNEYLKKLSDDREAAEDNRPRSRSRVKSEKRSRKRSRSAFRKQPQQKKRR